MRHRRSIVVAALAAAVASACLASPAVSHAGSTPPQQHDAGSNNARHLKARHWVASWIASPTDGLVPFDAAFGPLPEVLDNQTLRMVVTPHLAGETLRIHLSNEFGRHPTTFGNVTIGRAHHAAATRLTPVTFDHRRRITVPTGKDVVSDPIHFRFAAFQPLAISIFIPGVQSFPTKHWDANATSYAAPPGTGDRTSRTSGRGFPQHLQSWLYVDGIDVRAPRRTASIVAFGDSITDGFVAATFASEPVTTAIADKNARYPDDLQRRIDAAGIPISILNAGIGSNRLVTDGEPLMLGLSGVQRFRRDALDVAGVRGVIVQEGINDLGIPPATTTAQQLIAGYKKLIRMAHAAHVLIWLATLLPASNAFFDGTLLAPKSERYREQTNRWIRHQHLADGVVDFAAKLRDPAHPTQMNPRFSGPDHLHPNLRGYRVMAGMIPLAQLRRVLKRS